MVPHISGMLLAIDPGTDTGWSLFDLNTNRLIACGLGDPRIHDAVKAATITRLVVEKPRINPGGPARPNDMITLAVKTGRWTGLFETAEALLVEPWEWKGGVKKEVSAERTLSRLMLDELMIVSKAKATGGLRGRPMAKSKVHNMMDGIGLGLHGVGRGMRSQLRLYTQARVTVHGKLLTEETST